MTGTTRFVCTDPDAGDFEFVDVDAVLDALEAALVQASDAAVRRRPPELAAGRDASRDPRRLGGAVFAIARPPPPASVCPRSRP